MRLPKLVIPHAVSWLNFFLVLFLTKNYELGFTPDSVEYFDVANSLANGNGIVDAGGTFVNHWPPLYPILLAILSVLTTLTVQKAAILVAAIALCITNYAFFNILKVAQIKLVPQLLAVSILNSVLITQNFLWFLTEGLFIAQLLLLISYIHKWKHPHSIRFYVKVGIVLGIMFLTRYATIGIFLGIIVFFLFQSLKVKPFFKTLVIRLGLVTTSFCLTVLPWAILSMLKSESVTSRELDYAPVSIQTMAEMFETFNTWINPSGNWFYYILLVPSSVVLLFHLSRTFCTKKNTPIPENVFVSVSIILSYIGFLIVSISFFDHATSLDHRILSPIFPLFLIVLVVFLKPLLKSRILKVAKVSLLLTIAVSSTQFFLKSCLRFYGNGAGFTSTYWIDSPTNLAISQIEQKKIVTNNYYAFRLYHPQRVKKLLPLKSFLNNEIEKSMDVCVVIFNFHTQEQPLLETVTSVFPNTKVQIFKDGYIVCND